MNKALLHIILLSALLLPLSASAAVRLGTANITSLSSGLVGYWPLDGAVTNWTSNTTRDLSGNGNTGSLISMSTTTSPVGGKIGGAIKFDGSTSYINAGTGSNINLTGTTITVSTWVNASSYPAGDTYAGLVIKGGYANNKGFELLLSGAGAGTSPRHMLFVINQGFVASTNNFPLNGWHHVTGVYDGSTIRIYIDGVLSSTPVSYTNSITSSSALNLQIGRREPTEAPNNAYLSGKIDDVRIYNRALSPQEVTQLYVLGTANVAHSNTISVSSGLVGYWPLDGNTINWTSNTARDLSGNGQTSNLTSLSTTSSPAVGKLGQALKFTGSPQIASSSLQWPSTGGTMALWVNRSQYSDWISPAGFKRDPAVSTNGYMLFDDSGSGGPGSWRFVTRPNVSGASEAGVTASGNISNNKWYFLTGVWSLSGSTYTIRFYVNGVDQGSATWTGSVGSTGLGSFHFGNSGDYTDNYWLGCVDDVRVYNRALSPQEITQLYSMGR